MSELAEAEMVSRPAITWIVKSLESGGLVARQVHATDRRRVTLRATPKGRSVMERGRARRVAHIANGLARLEKHEVATLLKATAILELPR